MFLTRHYICMDSARWFGPIGHATWNWCISCTCMDIDERLFMSGNGNLFILETLHKYLESRPSYFYLLWQRSAKKVDKQAATVVVHEGLMGETPCVSVVVTDRPSASLLCCLCARCVFRVGSNSLFYGSGSGSGSGESFCDSVASSFCFVSFRAHVLIIF